MSCAQGSGEVFCYSHYLQNTPHILHIPVYRTTQNLLLWVYLIYILPQSGVARETTQNFRNWILLTYDNIPQWSVTWSQSRELGSHNEITRKMDLSSLQRFLGKYQTFLQRFLGKYQTFLPAIEHNGKERNLACVVQQNTGTQGGG